MAKIFIAGGAGFIGHHLSEKFITLGHEVFVYDAFLDFVDPQKSRYHKHLQDRLQSARYRSNIIRGDIRDVTQLIHAINKTRPEIFINLAAVSIDETTSLSSESLDVNLNGLVSIFNALRATDSVRRFVHTSSSFVYGNFQFEPAPEIHPLRPINIYGGTKMAGEALTHAFGNGFNIEYSIIRPTATYGPTDANRRWPQRIIENALAHKPVEIKDGDNRVDFTHIEDTVEGFVLIALHPAAKNEVFNIAQGKGYSINEFIGVLKKIFPDWKTIASESPGKPPKRGALDITKAQKLLGYSPKISLEEGVARYVTHMRKYGI